MNTATKVGVGVAAAASPLGSWLGVVGGLGVLGAGYAYYLQQKGNTKMMTAMERAFASLVQHLLSHIDELESANCKLKAELAKAPRQHDLDVAREQARAAASVKDALNARIVQLDQELANEKRLRREAESMIKFGKRARAKRT